MRRNKIRIKIHKIQIKTKLPSNSINNQLLKKAIPSYFLYLNRIYLCKDDEGERNSNESVSVRSEQVHFHVFNILGLDDIL